MRPFIEGNGRAGRLSLNLVLVRLGYPPVIIYKKQRDRYLAGPQKSDDGDHCPLGELIARAMLDNLTLFIVPNVAGRRDWSRSRPSRIGGSPYRPSVRPPSADHLISVQGSMGSGAVRLPMTELTPVMFRTRRRRSPGVSSP